MFWKYNSTTSSQIETLLCKEHVTLQEVMNEDDVINECKVQNRDLIDFLLKPEIMEELVTLTTVEPSGDMDERNRFKYPNIACELLTCDVPALNERLAGDKELLSKLYAFLDSEPPLNPLLASYFSKIMGVLIAKKTEQNWLSYQFTCLQVLDFLKEKENFINLLLKHLGTSAIMDLILKLMTQVEGIEMRQNILNWLDSQRIIQSLIALMNPSIENEKHYNVAQLLCDFIKISRDNQRSSSERNDPDPLLNTLESPELVSSLLDNILGENKCESAIVGGIQILLGLLDFNKTSIPKYDSQNIYNADAYEENDWAYKQKVIQNTTQAIVKRMKDFHNLLLDPPKKSAISTTVGVLNPPLGNTRLQVVKLFASLLSTCSVELAEEFTTLNTMQVLLDLFFQYPWNNFLHTQVEACILSALKFDVSSEQRIALCKHLLVNCKLIQRILDAWKENDETQAQEKGIRQGYMGHLISILNGIVEKSATSYLGQFMKENMADVAEEFDKFKNSTLQETNKTREMLLGGVNPNSSNEGSDDYGDMLFTNQGVFAQYQMQQLTPSFIESYGFHDEDFNDADDSLPTIDARTGTNFDLSERDLIRQQELFKEMCAQNINTLDDDEDQIFEDRDHTFQTVIEKRSERHDAVYSSDSDDDSPTPGEDPNMDVDPWSSSPKPADSSAGDPWGAFESKLASNETGWADFSSATFPSFEEFVDSSKDKANGVVAKEPELVVENDLKVENIEIDCKDETKTNPPSEEMAGEKMDEKPEEKIEQTESISECEPVVEKEKEPIVVAAQGGDPPLVTENITEKVEVVQSKEEEKSEPKTESTELSLTTSKPEPDKEGA